MFVMYPKREMAIYTIPIIGSLNFRNKMQEINVFHKTATSILLMAVLVLSVAVLSTAPYNTEAQLSSDFCERFGIICEGVIPPTPPPAEETPPPAEETPPPAEETPPPAEETPPPAEEVDGGTDFTKMVWTTTRSTAAQRDLANQILDSGDIVMFHYAIGRDPTSTHISHLKAVTTVPDEHKGFEFFTLAEIQEHAQTVADNGFGFISYDLETGISPTSETSNPTAAFRAAKQAADEAGIDLAASPNYPISNGDHLDDIAKLVDYYHLQSQRRQDDDRTCDTMRNWISNRMRVIEGANPDLEGEISYQVTLSRGAAEGKTIFQTTRDCIQRVSPSDADGNLIWWNAASFDNGNYQELLRFHENNYS
jgi:hypothetical protein